MDSKESLAANELWRRHSEEEATARKVQQEHAGSTHRPVDGPPPYGSEQVNLLAAEIVSKERERCARLVETWPGAAPETAELLRQVAAALRQGG